MTKSKSPNTLITKEDENDYNADNERGKQLTQQMQLMQQLFQLCKTNQQRVKMQHCKKMIL